MKDLSYYRSLPYTRVVSREEYEGEIWFAVEIPELPGLTSAGRTRAEAMVEMDKAFDAYIQANLEWGHEVPEPTMKLPRYSPARIQRTFRFKDYSQTKPLVEPQGDEKPVAFGADASFVHDDELVSTGS